MDEPIHTNTEPGEILPETKRRFCYCAVICLILSVLSIPAMYMAYHRIESVHHQASHSCILVADSPVHTVIHNLSSILPAVSIMFGVLALMRIARGRGRLRGKYLAIAGVVVSVGSLVVYGLVLVRLIS